jgi:hypothetical protein
MGSPLFRRLLLLLLPPRPSMIMYSRRSTLCPFTRSGGSMYSWTTTGSPVLPQKEEKSRNLGANDA